ncbi:hypothetical protein PR003_g13625 [Phytophthora rubi]|uniref:Uncharacterized protein n=1 Tax=Phytophthora rubi TaxID=129364 RepID=A0A6A4F860_9STRA|nr:hypothetical protein PR003_g13625 [Phytophthora rubi]
MEVMRPHSSTSRLGSHRNFGFNNSSVERDSAIEELVHNVELAKTNNAQANMLGMSILEVLYATVEDEQEFEPF